MSTPTTPSASQATPAGTTSYNATQTGQSDIFSTIWGDIDPTTHPLYWAVGGGVVLLLLLAAPHKKKRGAKSGTTAKRTITITD